MADETPKNQKDDFPEEEIVEETKTVKRTEPSPREEGKKPSILWMLLGILLVLTILYFLWGILRAFVGSI